MRRDTRCVTLTLVQSSPSHIEFDLPKTVLPFVVPLLVIVGGTVTSPMPQAISIGVSVGIALFGVLALVVGIKHGEYRATR